MKPTSPYDSGLAVIYSDFATGDGEDETRSQPVCLHCLIQDGDEHLGRGMDLARQHGQVDFDLETGEWFVPPDAGWTQTFEV